MLDNPGSVCVIVVLFNPKLDQIANFEHLCKSVDVVFVDNSKIENQHPAKSHYIPLYENKGIAYAQNQGIKYAIKNNFKYILFFDQDSKVDNVYIDNILAEYKRIKKINNGLRILGPLVLDEKNGVEYKSESKIGDDCTEVSAVISSGSLVDSDLFNIIGFLDESLFIDYVDCEICWRASNYGFSTYITRNVILFHNVGSLYRTVLGIPFGVSAPFRYYYQFRNMLWLIRREYVPFEWKCKSLFRSILDLIVVPFLSGSYFDTLKNMLKGYYSGLKKQPSLNGK